VQNWHRAAAHTHTHTQRRWRLAPWAAVSSIDPVPLSVPQPVRSKPDSKFMQHARRMRCVRRVQKAHLNAQPRLQLTAVVKVENLSELISHYLPSRSLRSSNTDLLTRPPAITSNFSYRPFLCLHLLLETLCLHTFVLDTLSTFKRHLKFHLFQSAFTVLSSRASASDSFSRFLALYIYLYVFVCMR